MTMSRSIFAVLSLLLGALAPLSHEPQSPQYDLLIRNGTIVDGSGAPGFKADLAVKGDRVVRIGDLSGATATRVIDAAGLVVAPGFIDLLGQSETYLLIDPRAMSKVMQGVTTEITGEGESIAPINERQIKEQEGFLRRFNLSIDWRTLDEYFKRLESGTRADEKTRCPRDARRRARTFEFTAIRTGAFCENV
jgi:dihydroorotase/N-acyl-D-amino-acid deacylase